MKVYLNLHICAEYSESNHQTLSLVEDFAEANKGKLKI